MKLAEALSLRADLQKRNAQLTVRLKNNSKYQEGDSPTEDPGKLYAEFNQNLTQLEDLIFRINKTNIHPIKEGDSLTRMLAKKDVLALRLATLREVWKYASVNEYRLGRSELYIRNIDIAGLQKDIDTYSRELRLLEMQIQRLNWEIDLE